VADSRAVGNDGQEEEAAETLSKVRASAARWARCRCGRGGHGGHGGALNGAAGGSRWRRS